jgi:hypothetical protein
MSANREHKNSVFIELFNNREKIIELYNAVTGSDVPSDTDIQIATLTDVLFTPRKNDIAFIMGGRLIVLFERQSTLNGNIPLSCFV